LRTPLNAVLGFTQLLEIEAGRSPVELQRQRLGHIRQAGEHLLSLINDMLDLSSLDFGQIKLQLQPVDLSGLLAEARALVEPIALEHQVALRVSACEGQVLADAGRLRQALVKVMSNAVKYTQPQGEVRVDALGDAQALTVRLGSGGRGSTAEQLLAMFEPFNRLGLETGGIDNAGIGLVIAKGLLEGMGGSIAVATNPPGDGALLEIRLPRAGAGAPRDAAAPDTDTPALRNGRLLYIEDNPVNVLLVEELVRGLPGLTLASECTGGAGVRHALQHHPDLVLVDIQLPDFDGFEVLRRLRADPRTADIPCVALSANAMPDDIARAREVGFADYWTKPIDFKAIVSALEQRFATRGS
jgi:CheY-like chemotaxis protein